MSSWVGSLFDFASARSYGLPPGRRQLPSDYNVVTLTNDKIFYRYRFVDAAVNDAVPQLLAKGSEANGYRTFRPRQKVKIRKTLYTRCRQYVDVSDALLQSNLKEILSDMNARIKFPRMLIGYGDFNELHSASSNNQLIHDIDFHVRMYTYFTFVDLKSDVSYGVNTTIACNDMT
ncbi:hypothetical protein Trydic_g6332 [Trypoxylus dichotomus]